MSYASYARMIDVAFGGVSNVFVYFSLPMQPIILNVHVLTMLLKPNSRDMTCLLL